MFKGMVVSVAALLLFSNEAIGAVDHVDFVPKNIKEISASSFKKECFECHKANYHSFNHTKPFTYDGETYFVLGDSMKKATNSVDTRQLVLQHYRETFKNAYSSSDFSAFISTYSSDDPDKLVPIAKKKLVIAQKREAAEEKARELEQYREAFKNARSSSDFETFIQAYQGKDPDKLIPKAKQKKLAAEKREQQERAEAARQEQHRREHACDHLYIGKVVQAPVSGLVNMFGIKSEQAIVIGISERHGVATVKSTSNSSMIGELSCSQLK